MKNKDFEEINDTMLGNLTGGTSNQGLFQFSFDNDLDETINCTQFCSEDCTNGLGTKTGTTRGLITSDPQ
ncbi:MAG: hypothetical protein LBM07_07510 [Culturomica sp.]|jgi:hypothetical protein|nr:hypothetical protein [Culturomica sp.]